MDYLVRRGEQEFGPYTLPEIQQYVRSGHVLGDDLTKNEGMAEWQAVSHVLGTIPSAPAVDVKLPEREAAIPLVKLPWNLHWAILAVLVVCTQQLFNFVWIFVLALWARRLTGNNRALVLICMYPTSFFAAGLGVAVLGAEGTVAESITFFLVIAGLIAYLAGIFSVRTAMEEYYNSTENIGLTMSGPMTLFFSTIYLQYHVNRLARWKKTGVLS